MECGGIRRGWRTVVGWDTAEDGLICGRVKNGERKRVGGGKERKGNIKEI